MTGTASTPTVSKQTVRTPERETRIKRPPLYHVILMDDDDHTFDYVIGMLRKLFGCTEHHGLQLAADVDQEGCVVVDTTTLERAELKRDQIHSFGRDWRIPRCAGSMSSRIEPVSG